MLLEVKDNDPWPKDNGNATQYKCILMGEPGVGKTSLTMRLQNGEFSPQFQDTREVLITPITLHTDHGDVCLNIWEVNFEERYKALCEHHFDCLLVMCDLSKQNYFLIRHLPLLVVECCMRMPTVLIGNKRDATTHGLTVENGTLMPFFEMSVKENLNIVEPLQFVIRKLMKDEELQFVEEFAPLPPEKLLGDSQLEHKLPHLAYTSPLPKDDDNW